MAEARASRFAFAVVLTGLACLHAQVASAQDAPYEPPDSAPAPTTAPTAPVVILPPPQAPPTGMVVTQHVDTVVVAEHGSHVTINPEPPDAAEPPPDRARTGALIASSIGWGLGIVVLGAGYLGTHGSESCSYSATGGSQCTTLDGADWLVSYDLNMAVVPSIPRWVVGDTTGALVYTGIRGASVLAASLVQWGQNDSFGPAVLGFLVPVTLGIVDLAMTPRREALQHDREPHNAQAAPGFAVTSLGPAPLTGPDHRVDGGALRLSASF